MGPDLIVYLEAPFERMLQNIRLRGRQMETDDPALEEYYHSVWQIYRDWYNSYGDTPTMKIDMTNLDFVNIAEDRSKVLDAIEQELINLGKLSDTEFRQIKEKRNSLKVK